MPAASRLLTILRLAYHGVRRIAVRRAYRLGAFVVLALLAAWPLLVTASSSNDFRDAQVLSHYESAARESVLRWHQWPLWDPYYCGGMYLLGTPQSRFVSPTFLLTLLLGETRAQSVTIFALITIGLEGAFRYARHRRATAFGAILAAPVFALSGLFAVSSSLGWVGFYGFELLPWIALGARRALAGERAGVVIMALAGAWCAGFGGTYAAPIAALWCVLELVEHVVVRTRPPARLLGGLGLAAAGASFALGVTAVRLLPLAETLGATPRIVGGMLGNSWVDLGAMLFRPTGGNNEHGSFYVGVAVIPASLLGFARWRRSAGPIVAAVLCAWLAAGYRPHPSLFALLRDLPVYSSLRYPERFLAPLALAMALLAAEGIGFGQTWILSARRRRARGPRRIGAMCTALAVAAVALGGDVVPLLGEHWTRDGGRNTSAAPVERDTSRPFRQARGNRWGLLYYEPMQRGSLSCWDAYPVAQSPLLRGDLAADEYLRDPTAGSVARDSWSPNAISLRVRLLRPTMLLVNQNWHPGWQSSVGEVQSEAGLLAVTLPAGEYPLTLRFRPRSGLLGGLTSLLALAGLAFWSWRSRGALPKRGRSQATVLAVLAGMPLAAIAAGAGTLRDELRAARAGAAASAPVNVGAVPDRAHRLATEFEGGVVLESVRLSDAHPLAGTDVTLELVWRRREQIAPGLGVFVHVEPSKGDTLNADHVLLSGEFDFDSAPPNAALRDVFPVHVPASSRGKTWKVWVGLWRVLRGGERVRVLDWGNAIVDNNRVLAATYEAR